MEHEIEEIITILQRKELYIIKYIMYMLNGSYHKTCDVRRAMFVIIKDPK